MTRRVRFRSLLAASLAALAGAGAPALAQSYCSSDGQRQPSALVERFISADCASCWGEAEHRPQPGELALDWIVPGTRGEDAPLSAAANRDSAARLAALQRPTPAGTDAVRRPVEERTPGLRVSHGLAFNGYIGASIELKTTQPGPWSAWLALVETIPRDTEGSPVERNLVRNTLELTWNGEGTPVPPDLRRFYELRSMNVAEGARPDRLRVVGWIEDGHGRIRAMAESRCGLAAARR